MSRYYILSSTPCLFPERLYLPVYVLGFKFTLFCSMTPAVNPGTHVLCAQNAMQMKHSVSAY